ncbi:hypothetical protein D3C75_1062300 [compost metagenome]
MAGSPGNQGHPHVQDQHDGQQRGRVLHHLFHVLEARSKPSGEGHKSENPGDKKGKRGEPGGKQDAKQQAAWRYKRHPFFYKTVKAVHRLHGLAAPFNAESWCIPTSYFSTIHQNERRAVGSFYENTTILKVTWI